jgi:hypothetical protein
MANETIKISVPDYDFETVQEAMEHFADDHQDGEKIVVEMINRYMSTQRMAKKYRQNKAQADKELKAKYEAAVKAGLIK